MADFPIIEGYFLLGGRSKENARKAIDEAQKRGFGADAVLTRQDGYLIPLSAHEGDAGDEIVSDSDEGEPIEIVGEAIEVPDESWKNDDIVAFAAEHGIDLGEATKKADMLAAIQAAIPTLEAPTGDEGDDTTKEGN